MKTIKQTAEYVIFQRRDGRYAVKNSKRKAINGDEKTDILNKEGLITLPKSKPAEAPVEEVAEADAPEADTPAE